MPNGTKKSQSGLRRTGTQKKGRQVKAAKKGYYGGKTSSHSSHTTKKKSTKMSYAKRGR